MSSDNQIRLFHPPNEPVPSPEPGEPGLALHMVEPAGRLIHVRQVVDGHPVAMLDHERKSLLESVRAGEAAELEVDIVAYIQRDTPNKNFVRFPDKVGKLRAIAKSATETS